MNHPLTEPLTAKSAAAAPVEWLSARMPVPYPEAVAAMEARVEAILRAGRRSWSGCSSIRRSTPPAPRRGRRTCSAPDRFPVYRSRRGGEYTYHGPGQRVAYAMLDLNRRGRDVRAYVWRLEEWVIRTLAAFSVDCASGAPDGSASGWCGPTGRRRPTAARPRTRSPRSASACAAGSPSTGWRSTSSPTSTHFGGIVPCGIRGHGVTSLVDLGLPVTMADLDLALRRSFEAVFKSAPDAHA